MLVLTRKQQEKIRIGDHITITVLKSKGKAVRLGIEAPAEVPVIRGELSFAGQAVEWAEAPTEQTALSQALPVSVEGQHSGPERLRDNWPTEARFPVGAALPTEKAARSISLQRVSREQISQALPKLAVGAGPLRVMLDRRSVSA